MTLHDHSNSQHHPCQDNKLKWRIGFVSAGFLVIAGILLFTEHRAHVFGVLIWLPLLVCPLMHLFMHGGHGGHGGHGAHGAPEQQGGKRTTQGSTP